MNKALFFQELKLNRKSFFIWTGSLVLLMILSVFKYSGISEMGTSATELFAKLPKFMLAMFNMTSLDITTFIGYFAVVFVCIQIMAVIYAGILGSTMLSREERDKTSEFLNTKPISRDKILTTKMISSMALIFLFTLASYIISIISVSIEKGNFFTEVLQMHIGMLFVEIIFFTLGVMLSVVKKSVKKVSGVTSSAIMIFYIIGVMQEMDNKFYDLRYITPFKFFQISDIASGKGLQIGFILASIIIAVIFIIISYRFYRKRDLAI